MARLHISSGTDEGAVYNANGANLTEWPDGPANRNVGSWFYDFAALNGLGILNTNELAYVLSDGRHMQRDNGDNFNELIDNFDNDEIVSDDEDQKGLDRKGYTTHVSYVTVELRLGFPTYYDVDVIPTVYDPTAGGENGLTNGYLISALQGSNFVSLAEWLDENDGAVWGAETAGDATVWWVFRSYLRWSLHWALYKVPISTPVAEAVSDDLEQAGFGPGGDYDIEDMGGGALYSPVTDPAPEIGPAGLVFALGGGPDWDLSSNQLEWPECEWVRLWHRTSKGSPVKFIRRGHIAGLPYNLMETQSADANPTQSYETDAAEGDQIFDIQGDSIDAPDTASAGREFVLRLKLKTNIDVGPDEMLVFHVQSGRARLAAPEPGTATAPDVQGLVIATGFPAMGPRFTVQHQSVTAIGRNRPMR